MLESTMSGTVAGSIEIDGKALGQGGARFEVDCVDIIEVRYGLVARKQTYIDSLTMQGQLGGE